MNHPLARALRSAGINSADVAARLGVDPKTVNRWIAGRLPYPRHRDALAAMTGWSPRDLWPAVSRTSEPATRADEVRIVYPHRSAIPPEAWCRFFTQAKREIGVLAYSALFLAEDISLLAILRDKARAGVRVRLALGHPEGTQVAARGTEEGIGDGMTARIRTAMIGFSSLVEAGAEMRLHDTVLYDSVYRADDELLVNAHIYGHPASHAPVLHLTGRASDGMVPTYLDAFERIWTISDQARRVSR